MTASFWLILLAVLGYGLLHTILASLRMKALARQWFGPKTDRWYRLIFNLIAIITLLPILAMPVLLSDTVIYRIPVPWVFFSMVIQLLAVIALLVGIKQSGMTTFLGLRQIFHTEQTSPPSLVTDGLYRYVRHPQYTAGLVFIWLMPIMTWNVLALELGLTAYIIVGAHFEERKVLVEFGETFAEYRKHTPMLVPFLRIPPGKSTT